MRICLSIQGEFDFSLSGFGGELGAGEGGVEGKGGKGNGCANVICIVSRDMMEAIRRC